MNINAIREKLETIKLAICDIENELNGGNEDHAELIKEARAIIENGEAVPDEKIVNKPEKMAVANFLLFGKKRIKKDLTVSENYVRGHNDKLQSAVRISFAGANNGRRSLCTFAPVTTAVYEALLNGVDENTLKRFCTVVNSEMSYRTKDLPAYNFSCFIVSAREAKSVSKVQIYEAAKAAIDEFVIGYPKGVL